MSADRKWFLLIDGNVKGPFLEPELRKLFVQYADCFVWGHGLGEWIKPDEWQKTIAELQSVWDSLQADLVPRWKFREGEHEAGPFRYDQLIQVLKAHPRCKELEIFHEPDGTWKDIYSYPLIVDEVRITRRDHPRVPISGIFRYELRGQNREALLSTISEGGLGIIEVSGIEVGDTFTGHVESPQISAPFSCQFAALYRQEDGGWGLRFLNLPSEVKSLIIEYTQKFKST